MIRDKVRRWRTLFFSLYAAGAELTITFQFLYKLPNSYMLNFRKINDIQLIKMFVVGYNKPGIGGNGAINKLVVIRI